MKYIETFITYCLEFIGIETGKLVLGDLFPTLAVAFVGSFFLGFLFIVPIRFFIKDEKVNPKLECIENLLGALAVIISFGGCLYLWSIGF